MNMDKVGIKNIAQLEQKVEEVLSNKKITHGLASSLRGVLKELHFYQNHIMGMRDWKIKKSRFSKEKIQVGGGRHYLEGFLNIDIAPPADLICDVREGLPLENECSELIFTEHFWSI